MSVFKLDPAIHFPRDTEAAYYFRHHLHNPDVMTFWNAETEEWVLGIWVDRGNHVVFDLEDLGCHFEKLTPQVASDIRYCYGRATDWDAFVKRTKEKHREAERKIEDDIGIQQERYDWAKKRAGGEVPYMFKV